MRNNTNTRFQQTVQQLNIAPGSIARNTACATLNLEIYPRIGSQDKNITQCNKYGTEFSVTQIDNRIQGLHYRAISHICN